MERDGVHSNDKQVFLKQYNLKMVLHSTIYHWMTDLLGLYIAISKNGHEWDNVVLYCSLFCKRYLTAYRPQCVHGLQLEKEVASQYPGLKDSEAGYNYIKDSVMMCEYHYDTVLMTTIRKKTMGLMSW